ncbi:NAD kinase isoform X1 [Rhagoletis pomonella]|uniref:NAD kinase isoform X1 n=2 Tax=Rhagoletis TaxID=28609 RepID=UPI00177EECDD|nr:NAD kinase isoform X1 [Rhagoletis pomonella]XP_036333729.1 NAD kinase isoform X1 [Rhagoletis pomonella]XP_036333730.1 NAD kinase isoform X1 [Rhagoletis pomonella]
MTCLSDIDLATLHKSRLEERLNYKLAWGGATTNRLTAYHQHSHHHQQQLPPAQYLPHYSQQQSQHATAAAGTNRSRNGAKKQQNLQQQQSSNHQQQQQQQLHTAGGGGGGSAGFSDMTRFCLQRNMHSKYLADVDDLLNGNHDDIELADKLRHLNLSLGEFENGHRKVQHKSRKSIAEGQVVDDTNGNYFTTQTRRRRSGTWPRTRSLNAPSPFQQFGPCGRIMKNQAMVMQIQDPASQRLTWYKPPLTVLVIKKVRDSTVLAPFVQLVEWLVQEKHMVVWVESAVLDDPLLLEDKKFQNIKEKLVTFKDGRDDLTDRIDFIVCLGGDGTLLYASLLFQQSVPPVMAFHLGSLGFLTPFQFDNFQEQVTNVLEGHAALTLRSRLRCVIYRKSDRRKESESLQQNQRKNPYNHQTEKHCTALEDNQVSSSASGGTGKATSRASTNILVLNEVVIDRGPSPYLSNIDLFLDGKYITSVQGDGLIVSTPTGSTAYAVAAGASMIHPSVPAIMVTPICPHSLSFRPIVVPAGVELKISISPDSRNTSWVSFDGRNRQELLHGDCLRVTTSIYPVPSICAQDQISDWFDSLAECLHWNVRKKQKCLDELCDLTASGSEDTLDDLDRVNDSILDS